MRLLYISMEYPPETAYGGIGNYVDVMAHAHAAAGHEVHVLSCVRGQDRRDYVDRGVFVHRRPSPHPPLLGRLMSRPDAPYRALVRLNAGWAAYRAFQRLDVQPDLIEVADWYAEGLLIALLGRVPVVMHLHGPLRVIVTASNRRLGWSGRLGDLLERATAHHSRLVISPSDRLARELTESGWLPPSRSVTVRHPVDVAKWKETRPVEETGPVVLCVGTLQRLKGQHLLIEAAGFLAREVPGLEVVFAGRSVGTSEGRPYVDVLRDQAARQGVTATFTGAVSQAELLTLYGKARVVAICSYHETLSMVGMEALASGRPLVCTATTGNAELVTGEGVGTVVAAGDAVSLAAGLRDYLVDRPLAAAAGDAARALVLRTATMPIIAARTQSYYEQVIRETLRK